MRRGDKVGKLPGSCLSPMMFRQFLTLCIIGLQQSGEPSEADFAAMRARTDAAKASGSSGRTRAVWMGLAVHRMSQIILWIENPYFPYSGHDDAVCRMTSAVSGFYVP